MSERFQEDIPDFRLPEFQPLPYWIADRLLGAEERVTWVRGPRWNPSWERHITHPALLLVTLPLGVVCLAALWFILTEGLGWEIVAGKSDLPRLPALIAASFFLFGIPTIFVLGISNGYFTRLVVTNLRIVCLQGYEICRSWNLNRLPPSLLRYRNLDGKNRMPYIDLDAVKSMLGGSSDKFTDAKTIHAFTKQLDQITTKTNHHIK